MMHAVMKVLHLVCVLAIAVALPSQRNYAEQQTKGNRGTLDSEEDLQAGLGYIARLDGTVFGTKDEVVAFGQYLEDIYDDVKIRKVMDLKTVKFLLMETEQDTVAQLAALPEIVYIEHNAVASIAQECVSHPAPETWGLDRIDQREALPYIIPLYPDATYIWGRHTGATVTVYVTDTGIDVEHPEFGGRASFGWKDDDIPNEEDENGHGTHVSGTIGAATYGVAKDVSLVGVKVFNDKGTGQWDWTISGLEWIIEDHESRSSRGTAKSVINMSLGSGPHQPADDAVEAAIAAGITVVVAAGNNNGDACFNSPGRVPGAVNVGATNVRDQSTTFTNYGSCVDLFAPGMNVLSTAPGEDTDVLSGTSMSAPHVAGVVARYMDSMEEAPLPEQVHNWITTEATPDAIEWSNEEQATSPNLLLYGSC